MIDVRFARFVVSAFICMLIGCLLGCSADFGPLQMRTEAQSPDYTARKSGNIPPPARSETREPASRPAAAKPLSLGQLIRKYPDAIKTNGPRVKEIALTFDDVPDPRFTPRILDILRKYRVKATFFIVGNRAAKHPDLVKRMVREGHSIGNHSYNHPQFTKISTRAFQSQIARTENIIRRIAGFRPRLIRPPYGEITERQLKWAKSHGYTLVNWNVDSLDWKGLPRERVKRNILSHVGKGSIILQHGGGGTGSNLKGTIEALPDVIETLRRRGYTFVTVPDLLNVPEKK